MGKLNYVDSKEHHMHEDLQTAVLHEIQRILGSFVSEAHLGYIGATTQICAVGDGETAIVSIWILRPNSEPCLFCDGRGFVESGE